jgi:ammonia channel protein AmtB
MLASQNNESMHRPSEDIPFGAAAWDVIEAGQRVLIDRVELLLLEVRETIARAERQAFIGALAVVLLVVAWLALNGTAAIALSNHVSATVAGSVIAAVNAGLGLAALAWARQNGAGRA